MSLVNKFIDSYENGLEYVFDNYVNPLINTSKDVISDNEYVKPLMSLRNNIIKNKIHQFINNIENSSKKDIKDFINDMGDTEKIFFVESLNKVVDLDDSLQIYLMTYLTTIMKEKKSLNYQQKSLYYNLNQFTEDDFIIFYCYYKNYILNDEYFKQQIKNNNLQYYTYTIDYKLKNKTLVEIIFKKFVSINIITDNSYVKNDEKTEFNNSTTTSITSKFGLSEFSLEFYGVLDEYFKESQIDCKEYLEIDENKGKITIGKIKLF